MNTPNALVAQILARTVEEGACLLWDGYSAHGSPQVFLDGRYQMVRRVLLGALRGPLQGNMRATYTCGEPLCVRPEHLKAATLRQIGKRAAREGAFGGLQRRAKIAAARRRQSRLSAADVARIREADNGAEIARELGIPKSTVSKIRRGDSWRPLGASVFGLVAQS